MAEMCSPTPTPPVASGTATLRPKNQLTLPGPIRDALGLREGDQLEFVVSAVGDLTVHATRTIAVDQAWFWTPQWQAGEREADEDIANGRFTRYYSDEEFLASFED